MRCARCREKEVEVVATLSVNGKIKNIGLCIECANIMGYHKGKIEKSDFTEYLKNLIEDTYPKKKQKVICSFCEMSVLDFLRKKRFGCPFCYLHLENFISECVSNIKNEYTSKLSIESIISRKEKELDNLDKLYLKLKTYLDYDDTKMAKKVISRIKKYDNSKAS